MSKDEKKKPEVGRVIVVRSLTRQSLHHIVNFNDAMLKAAEIPGGSFVWVECTPGLIKIFKADSTELIKKRTK